MSESEIIGGLEIEFLINNPQILAALMQTEGYFERSQKSIQSSVNQTSSDIESFAKRAAATAAGYFSLQAAKNFVQELINVRGEFEQIQIAYQTILKSKEKGDALFAETVKLAATTPFNLTEVAQSTKQLLAYGFGAKEVTDVLTTLGNVAAGVSAPIGDIAYLYGTLKTQGRAYAQDIRQFTGRGIPIIAELAKQFGVTNEAVNKLVEQGKVGFPEIEKAFKSLTGAGGIFYNLMEKQSKTLTGQLSNLGDAFSQMLNDIGKGNSDILAGGIQAAASVIANYQKVLDIIEELVIVYGIYKAVVIATTAVQALQTAGLTAFTVAQLLQYGALSALTSAQVALNSAQAIALINTGAITAAIAILVFAVRALSTEYEHMHIAEKQIAEIRATGLKGLQDEQLKISQLTDVLKDHNSSQEERAKAITKLNAINPEFLGGLTQQNVLTQQGTDAINKYLTALDQKLEGEAAYATKLDNLKKINDVKTRGYDALGVTEEAGAILSDFFTGGIFKGGDAKTRVLNDYIKAISDANDKISKTFKAQLKKMAVGDAPEVDSAALARAKKFAEDLKEPIKNFDALIKEINSKSDAESLNKALQEKLDGLAPNDKQIAGIKTKLVALKKVLDQYSIKADQKAVTDANAEQQRRNKIYDDVAKLNEAQYQNQLTADQKEVEQVKSKYVAILKEIDRFNADKKNKTKIDPTKVSINGVVTNVPKAEQGAVDEVLARQSVEKQKTVIEQQKAMFDNYEKYKQQVGEAAAKELYADQIKDYSGFLDYLKKLQPTEAQLTTGTGAQKATAAALFDYLKKERATAQLAEVNQNARHLEELLIQNQTYAEKTQHIIDKALNDAKTLRDKSNNAAADNVILSAETELNQRDLYNHEILSSYRTFNESVERLSYDQAKLRIDQARNAAQAELETGKITQATYNGIIDAIKRAEAELGKNTILNAADALGAALGGISQSLVGVNDQVSKTIGGLAKGLTQMAELARNVSKLKDVSSNFTKDKAAAGGGFLGTVSGIAGAIPVVGGVISGVISAVGSVVNFFNEASETAKASAEELINFVTRGIDAERAYERQMRERARTQQDINALTLTELNARKQMLSLQADQAKADYERLLAGAANGAFISGEHSEKYGGFLGIAQKTKVVADLASTSGKDYDELEKLYIEGKLTDSTKAWFEQLKSAKDEMDAIGVSAADTLAAINKIATGTTADAIASAIIDGFKQGKRTAADFADDFKTLMQNAAISVFESNYLSKKIAEFYDQFAAASNSEGGLTADKIKALKDAYGKVIDDAGKEFDALGKIIGTPLDNSSSDNSLVGGIKGITSDEAGVLAGTTHAIQLAVLESTNYAKESNNTQKAGLAEMRQQTLLQMEIAANTKRTADSIDNDVTPALNKIANNTASSSGLDQRAAGFFGY